MKQYVGPDLAILNSGTPTVLHGSDVDIRPEDQNKLNKAASTIKQEHI